MNNRKWWKLLNQRGVSLVGIIIMMSVGTASIAYVITNVVPQLSKSMNKNKSVIDFKIFVGSLNDYIIHGVKERWCVGDLGTVAGSPEITKTDFLLGNDCSSSKTMEEIVSFKGNLERILWGPGTRGDGDSAYVAGDAVDSIKKLNGWNIVQNPSDPPPVLDIAADVKLVDRQMKFRLTSQILSDLTNTHPLYLIAAKVRGCIDYVDVTLKKENDINNIAVGEEIKISIEIDTKLKTGFASSCSGIRVASSKAFYTYYPRRLHTFSLYKYGDLDAGNFSDFHGPVYIAGNLKLPSIGGDKNKTSRFYDTVTLGTYNGGTANAGLFYAGKIVNSSNQPYTFTERGHPEKGKHFNYEEFRGILGGVRLDGGEDKGFVYLFDQNTSVSADVTTLEQCIEENNALSTPSANIDSKFGYYLNSKSSTGTRLDTQLGISDINRFKPIAEEPTASGAAPGFGISIVNGDPQAEKMVQMKIELDGVGGIFNGYLGAQTVISLEYLARDMVDIDSAISTLNGSVDLSQGSWSDYLNGSDVIGKLNTKSDYQAKGEALKDKCDSDPASDDCKDYGYSDPCHDDSSCTKNYSAKRSSFISAKADLKGDVDYIKTEIDQGKKFAIEFSLDNQLDGVDLILNKKQFKITENNSFNWIRNKIAFEDLTIDLDTTSYHHGVQLFNLRLAVTKNDTKIRPYDSATASWDPAENLKSNDWHYTETNNKNGIIQTGATADFRNNKVLICPDGVGVADWALDMSESANFSWNYNPTLGDIKPENEAHNVGTDIIWGENINEGRGNNLNMSIVTNCTVPADREIVYGFYVCENLTIDSGRTKDLYMIGSFIVSNLVMNNTNKTVHWHSIWDEVSSDLIVSNLKQGTCDSTIGKTWKDYLADPILAGKIDECSAQALVEGGPNNFTWTTIDPDIGLAEDNDAMTSKKISRIQNYIVKEDSRVDIIK